MASIHAPSVRRRRELKEEEEDATTGLLGSEFTGNAAQPLLISEVRLILQQQADAEKEEGVGDRESTTNPIYKKTLDYLELFSRYKNLDTVRSVRQDHIQPNLEKGEELLDENGKPIEDGSLNLTGYEMVQIADLAIEDVEEAKTLIPTLASKDDGQLGNVLAEIASTRRFQQ